MDESEFVFWDEVNNDDIYSKLFPQNIDGRTVLYLYDKIDANEIPKSFTLLDIHSAIKVVKPISLRNQVVDNNDIIFRLQKYFLRYNLYNQTYSLSQHAITFGKLAYSTLHKNFLPSKIKDICKELRELLDKHIRENTFHIWKEIHFEGKKQEFQKQIEILDDKISKLIDELQSQKNKDVNFLLLLQETINKLDKIEIEYEKLETAFSETRDIKELLSELGRRENDLELDSQIEEAINFFEEKRIDLQSVKTRLKTIQPKIKQKITIFSRLGFVTRIDKFIDHLIDKSNVVNNVLILPDNVELFTQSVFTPKFIGLKVWEEQQPLIPRQEQNVTPEKRKEAFAKEIKKVEIQKEAQKILIEFEKDLIINKEILVSTYFFKILKGDWDNFRLAVKFSYLIMKKYNRDKDWKLEVMPYSVKFNTQKSVIELWEMRVFQRFQKN